MFAGYYKCARREALTQCLTSGAARIGLAVTDPEIASCFDVMAELRPQLERGEFVSRIRRLQEVAGYRLAYLSDPGVCCVAGFRVSEWLAGGRYLEIEDLVTASCHRSRGCGGRLFDWLVGTAAAEACDHVRLVSRLHRDDAHRFYQRKGMTREAYYFSLGIKAGPGARH